MATVAELYAELLDMAAFLETYGLPHAADVRRSADEVGRGDAHGARRFLGLNRALLDIYIHPANGNAPSPAEAERLQRQLEAMHSRAYEMASALIRATDGGR